MTFDSIRRIKGQRTSHHKPNESHTNVQFRGIDGLVARISPIVIKMLPSGPVPMTEPVTIPTELILSFGPFRLLPSRRLVLNGERPVRLGSRAFEILVALVERQGEFVSKDQLITRAWPSTHVSEGNLKFQIAGLRRALDDGRDGRRYIETSAGRGYRLATAVTVIKDIAPVPRVPTLPHRYNLPIQLTRLIGRASVVNKLLERVPTQRLLTIAGPAGIGKTSTALAVAERLIPNYEHGVWLIDLAPISDSSLVPTALASALSLDIRSDNPLPGLVTALRDKQMLLVLDNCEHVIKATAELAGEVLRGSRRLHVLATSREPLGVEGEQVYRLSTLDSPPEPTRLCAAEALTFPAIQLFVERARANVNEFQLTDADAPSVGYICRKLDGIPLAIEFAAARVDAFGVRGLAAHLNDRLVLLKGGHRTAPSRQQTINAALDWSFRLLSQAEQIAFRRLAIFVGSFTLDAALAAIGGAAGVVEDIAESVTSLVKKSLISADMGNGTVRFRLLEITRAYASAKLTESGEVNELGRRHAAYYRDLLEAAPKNLIGHNAASAYATDIDNIRAALTWAFSPTGDRLTAVSLAAASASIWLEMSLLTECHVWMGKALDLLEAADRGTRREMVLQTEFGLSLMFTQGMSNRARAALTRASELAESLQDCDYCLRALAALTRFCIRLEEFQGALALARRAESIANDIAEPVALSTAESMISTSLFFRGEYAEALAYAQRARRRNTPVIRPAQIVRSEIDHSIQAGCVVTQVLLLQGLIDQSISTARQVVAHAKTHCNPVSLCFALVWCGCSNALMLGDLESAEHSITLLKDHAETHDFASYHAYGLGFEGQLFAKRGGIADGERQLRACLVGLRRTQYEVPYTLFLSALADVLATAGRFEESVVAADEALQRTQRSDGFWWMPEALRIKGEILMLSDRVDDSEYHFRQSLDLARRQGALSWELRTAMSLGRMLHRQGRVDTAGALLRLVYSRFAEGLQAADLKCARQLLEEWASDKARQKKARR
jgi:predicted ATPase/DNA-binding winged helix-turn-helix (wHTH) protein